MNQEQIVELIFEKNRQIHRNLIRLVVEEIEKQGEGAFAKEFSYLSNDCLNSILSSYQQIKHNI